jgi:hypothetical protein
VKTWRVEISRTHERTNRTEREHTIVPAPSLEAAIDFCKWTDGMYPPIEPFLSTIWKYDGREATATERDAYYANLDADERTR